MAKFKLGICGGTFDLFHIGHKTFINEALKKSEKIILGITSNTYIKTFKANEGIESYSIRKRIIENFLQSHGFRDRVKVISIDSSYEPLLTDLFDPEVIFVTPQTEETAKKINQNRKYKKLKDLKIIVLPFEKDENGQIISSRRIRNGEINKDGKLYLNPKWKNKKLVLPANLRLVLQRPFGEVLDEVPRNMDASKIVVIGDITAQKFNKDKINQFLSIIDFLVQRKIKFNSLPQLGFGKSQKFILVKNPAGTINSELFEVLGKIFKENGNDRKVILIKGEEDLAALAVLLVAPLGHTIFYGQPNQGLVRVMVNEENKEKVYNLLEKFTLI